MDETTGVMGDVGGEDVDGRIRSTDVECTDSGRVSRGFGKVTGDKDMDSARNPEGEGDDGVPEGKPGWVPS